MSNLIERQHLDPEEGDALVIPKSFRQRWLGLFEQFPGLSKWSLCRG